MTDLTSAELVARWRDGDQQAADELFQRYTEQLLALARRQLSAKLARRLDPEDVVQSAYRSFFAGARADRYVLHQSGDLWRLLAAITLHKLHRQIEHHTAAKRSFEREQDRGADSSLFGLQADTLSRDPSPAEVLAIVDELEYVMRALKPLHRQMVELRLQGYRIAEIAAATDRSERWVRRILDQIKSQLQQRYRVHAGC
jgi:RNA polymerase sigma-70 factor (ECF subfamily)